MLKALVKFGNNQWVVKTMKAMTIFNTSTGIMYLEPALATFSMGKYVIYNILIMRIAKNWVKGRRKFLTLFK